VGKAALKAYLQTVYLALVTCKSLWFRYKATLDAAELSSGGLEWARCKDVTLPNVRHLAESKVELPNSAVEDVGHGSE